MTPGTMCGGAVEQLEALARKPLQPRRALLRHLAVRFRAIGAAEPAQDRRAA